MYLHNKLTDVITQVVLLALNVSLTVLPVIRIPPREVSRTVPTDAFITFSIPSLTWDPMLLDVWSLHVSEKWHRVSTCTCTLNVIDASASPTPIFARRMLVMPRAFKPDHRIVVIAVWRVADTSWGVREAVVWRLRLVLNRRDTLTFTSVSVA